MRAVLSGIAAAAEATRSARLVAEAMRASAADAGAGALGMIGSVDTASLLASGSAVPQRGSLSHRWGHRWLPGSIRSGLPSATGVPPLPEPPEPPEPEPPEPPEPEPLDGGAVDGEAEALGTQTTVGRGLGRAPAVAASDGFGVTLGLGAGVGLASTTGERSWSTARTGEAGGAGSGGRLMRPGAS